MTTDFKDVLIELDSKIDEVYDLDLAEEMSDIYIDLSGRINGLDTEYWKLVKTLAKTEKDRDDLFRKLDIEKKMVKMTFEIGMDLVQEECKVQDKLNIEKDKLNIEIDKLNIEKDQIEYDRDYYRDEVYRLRAQNEALMESHNKCIDVIKKLL